MKSKDSIGLGIVGVVAIAGIIIMTLFSTYNINEYYGFAARSKSSISLTPGLSFEAESGINQGFSIAADPKASSKQYVYSPDGSGSMSYSFKIDKPGLYKISTKVATAPLANSFYVQLNNNEKILVQASDSKNYVWNDVLNNGKKEWLLSPGNNTIILEGKDPGVKIDSIALSLVASQCIDNDDDGYGASASELCLHINKDCNDLNPGISPGAEEICGNNVDDNCNGAIDESCLGDSGDSCTDIDGDGYGASCGKGPDCNDNNPSTHALLSCNYDGNTCGTYNMCVASCVVPPQEICGNSIDEDCDGVAEECSPLGLSRSFPKNIITGNSTITITITKTLLAGQSTLLVEEYVPTGFTVVDSGAGVAVDNTIRWSELTGAVSGTYTYSIMAPNVPGVYSFSGVYTINGGSENAIVSDTQLTVQSVFVCTSDQTRSCSVPEGLGICSTGIQTCSNNAWGSCVALTPTIEVCNNSVDEDCDGSDLVCSLNVTGYPVNTIIQAENGNNNGFTIANGYVYTNTDSNNGISYAFNVQQAGQYVVDTGIVAPNSGTDSFYIGLDGFNALNNNAYIFDSVDGAGVVENTVRLRGPAGNSTYFQFDPMVFTLSQGVHTFTFYGRERNTKMDYLRLRSYNGSIIQNTLPTVSIISPLNNYAYVAGSNITINVSATDVDGSINRVEFYRSTSNSAAFLLNDTSAPYIYNWGNAQLGNYNITVIAYDDLGGSATANSLVRINPVPETCGNGYCVAVESCNSCPEDCGVCSAALSRSFSVNPAVSNSVVTVTLTKTLLAGQSTLLVEEYVPVGFTVVDSGIGVAVNNTIRWSELGTAASSISYAYTVRTPSIGGDYAFSGVYTIDGSSEISTTAGDSELTVQSVFVCTSDQTRSCSVPEGLGICSTGIQTCSNNAWGSCVALTPTIEVCNNNVDEDCDGVLNNGCTGFCDTDDDGHNQVLLLWCAIYGPIDDCNDDNANINPGATEICGNRIDEDCSGSDLICANTPPIVSISGPATKSVFNVGANITIVALASDPNGSISKVEFYANNLLIGTDSSFPYSYVWNNVGVGDYVVFARAYDNLNDSTNSMAINISVIQPVNVLPTVSITAPVSGTNFAYPSPVTITATAADSDGYTTKVEFYVDNVLIGTDTISPYSYTWNTVTAGNHTLTARAFDNLNAAKTSSAVNIGMVQAVTNGLSRSFSSNPAVRNTAITVIITKNLLAGQSTVLAEEYVPMGYVIVSSGTGLATGNTIRWAELTGATSGTYNYTVRTPTTAGTGTFSGMYTINGGATVTTAGSTQLTVQ